MSVRLKKGGNARFEIRDFKNYNSFKMPAGFIIDGINVLKKGTTAGNIKLGTYVKPVKEIQTLTITAEPTANGNLTIVLDGATGVVIPILDADLIAGVCTKIAAGTYLGWETEATATTVKFTSVAVGARTGAFTFSPAATGVTGAFVETVIGVTEAVGEQVVSNTALSTVNGNFSALTVVKKLYPVDEVLTIGVDSVATGTLVLQLQKIF
jgi:hypothetical protein